MNYKCEQCGNPLKRKKRFCSDHCRQLWWKNHPEKRKKYLLTCKECFGMFETIRKSALYCSAYCRNQGNSRQYTKNLDGKKKHIAWACGGGIDSTAIAVLIIQGKIEKPDYAYMTDCGYEQEQTMDYVYNIIQPRLKEVDIDLHIIKSTDYVDNSIINKHGVTIPAYTKRDGEVIKLSTRCSNTWKKTPAFKFLKEKGVERMVNIIGIAAEESRRVKISNVKWAEYKYPLVDMNLSRRDCKIIIKDHGWSLPSRSTCIMCPQQSDNQWLDLRDYHNNGWEKAVMIEQEMRRNYPNVYLHHTCVPLDKVKFVGGGG